LPTFLELWNVGSSSARPDVEFSDQIGQIQICSRLKRRYQRTQVRRWASAGADVVNSTFTVWAPSGIDQSGGKALLTT
jgi:hypothetical protein